MRKSISCLLLLPNTKANNGKKFEPLTYVKNIISGAKSVFTNAKVNYNVYYSAMLTGFTSIFVWNFQPLLKLSSAPVILYGIINFINQIFRAIGGLIAKNFASKFKKYLIAIEYFSVLLSFILLISGYYIKNYIFIFCALFIICIAIILFIIFNVFNISNLHKNTESSGRATSASVNTFAGDLASFLLLLNFKFIYDKLGIYNTLTIFMVFACIILFPAFGKRFQNNN